MDKRLCKKCLLEKDIIFFNKDYIDSCKECQKNYKNR